VKGGFHRPGFEAPDLDGLPKAGRRRPVAGAAA
jgi:flagellar biosynthesis protein FlhB